MGGLSLSVLGGFQLRDSSGAPLSLPAKKSKALLAYLALQPGEVHPRDKLAALLWEESGDAQARHSLRQALAALRRCMPAQALTADGEAIGLTTGAIEVDAHTFERLARSSSPEALERAAELYRGELLEGFHARAPAFEDWLMHEQSRLREQAIDVLQRLLAHYRQSAQGERAIQLALRLLALDPLRESVHRDLMECYARQGRYGQALRQYRICRSVLQRELGVAPEPATERLYRHLLQARRAPTNQGRDIDAALPSEEAASEASSNTHSPLYQRGAEGDLSAPAQAFQSQGLQAQVGAVSRDSSSLELRQATVLVTRLAGMEGTAADPEQAHECLSRYLEAVGAAVGHFGGCIVQRMGDAVMTVFGLPAAHSNDPERAVRAADAIQRAVAALPGQCLVARLAARVGIACGRVMVGGGGGEQAVTGEAAEQALAIAARAGAGETLLADGVYQGVYRLLAAERAEAETGPHGLAQPIQSIWRMRSLGGSDVTQGRAAFVGRRAERRVFAGAVEACLETGCGQAFLVRGEAGIGKTRLTEELEALAQASGFACHCALVLDFGTATGQDAVRALVRGLLDLMPASAATAVQRAAERALADGMLGPEQRVFLNDLLDLPQPPDLRAVLDAMDDAARQRGMHAAVSALLRASSRQPPRLLVVEDIHWADERTLAHLADIARTVGDCPALLVMTSRVEGEPLDPGWRGAMQGAALTTFDLGPLREEEALALAQQYGAPEADAVRRCIARAGGNPLFLEQLLRVAGDGGECVPDSVQSIAQARLDRLEPADKQAAQAASVMGQRFSLVALRDLLDDPQYGCGRLIEQRLVRPEAAGTEDYLFAHALIQEGIYGSLPRSRRRALHRRTAEWFAPRDPVLHAEHLDRAEDPAAAQAYLAAARSQAAEHRQDRALDLVRRGLELAGDRAARHALVSLQGELLRDSGRIADSIAAFEHALALADDDLARCRAWIGKAAGLSIQDRHPAALDALVQAERLAAGRECPCERAQIHYHRGNVLFTLARIEDCLAEHERALEYAAAGSPLLQASALSGLADAYYQRGRMGTAQDYVGRCVALCREHGLARIEAANLAMLGLMKFYQNDVQGALADNQEAAALAARIGNLRDESLARNILGTLLLYSGDCDGAREQAERSLALTRSLGAKRFEAENLCTVAQALAQLGRRAQAEALLETAWALSRESGPAYNGPWILAALASVTADPEKRRRALAEGESILRAGAVSHNYLHFYQIAMDVALASCDWREAERYAAGLEDYTRPEPLPWSDFLIDRGRTLARFGEGARDAAVLDALHRLRREAESMGLRAALPALDAALAEI